MKHTDPETPTGSVLLPGDGGKAAIFSSRQLKQMIVPLILEQFLLMLVGLADTFIVSYAGEAAVSGVSLVNSFNTIFLYLFTALASGGAVIVSQYIGSGKKEAASQAVSQLLMISAVLSAVIMLAVLVLNRSMIGFLFGKVEPDVKAACITYLRISAYSYPALAVYNAGAALYRSIGKTRTTMNISAAANVINVAGNLIGVFVLKAGVAGVAYPSLISRAFSAVVITVLCFRDREDIRYRTEFIFAWNGRLLRQILGIAVPNGVESGIFQFVKVALSSVVALFGTYQIAANGIAQSIWSVAALISCAMGPVFITVIGQCMGGGRCFAGGSLLQKADEDHPVGVPAVECPGVRADALYPAVLRGFGSDKAAYPLVGPDPQHRQLPDLPLCGSPGERPAGRRRCALYHGDLAVHNHRRVAFSVSPAGRHAQLGRHRYCRGHVPGLGDTGGHFLDPLPPREMEGVSCDRINPLVYCESSALTVKL